MTYRIFHPNGFQTTPVLCSKETITYLLLSPKESEPAGPYKELCLGNFSQCIKKNGWYLFPETNVYTEPLDPHLLLDDFLKIKHVGT